MTGEPDNNPLFSISLSPIDAKSSGTEFIFEATEKQCAAIAARLGCVDITIFGVSAKIIPLRKERRFRAKGKVNARVVQNCVVSLEPVVSNIDQDLDVVLLPEDCDVAQEFGFKDDDVETYSGDAIDLGEIGVVELALAIDPYPRAPNISLSELGPQSDQIGYEVQDESSAGRNRPFEALAAIKGKR